MALLKKMGDRDPKNYFQACLDETKLAARKPNTTDDWFEIRVIPEVDDQGNLLPLIRSLTQAGADYSNFLIEPVAVNAGARQRFSGLCRSSDRMEEDESDTVWSQLFITARAAQKRKEIPPELRDEVEGYLTGDKMKAQLKSIPTMAIVQCLVVGLKGRKLDRVLPKQAVFLTSSAVEDLDKKLSKLYEEDQIDVADPAKGRIIRFTPEEQRGSGIKMFTVDIMGEMPIKPETLKKLWIPWGTALRRHPFDHHLRAAVSAYSPQFVNWVFPSDYGRLYGEPHAPARPSEPSGPADPVEVDDLPGQEGPVEAADDLQIDLDAPPELDETAEEPPKTDGDQPATGEEGNALDVSDPDEVARSYEQMLDDM